MRARPLNAEKVEKGCVSANRKEGVSRFPPQEPKAVNWNVCLFLTSFDEMGAKI